MSYRFCAMEWTDLLPFCLSTVVGAPDHLPFACSGKLRSFSRTGRNDSHRFEGANGMQAHFVAPFSSLEHHRTFRPRNTELPLQFLSCGVTSAGSSSTFPLVRPNPISLTDLLRPLASVFKLTRAAAGVMNLVSDLWACRFGEWEKEVIGGKRWSTA